MGRIIGIVSGKGGVGKTTLAINLGAALVKNFNKNVTVIDCNLTTSHVGLYLGIYYSPLTLNKVLRGDTTIEEAIYEHFTGMKVIPASLSLADLEGIDIISLGEKIREISDRNDIIFLDSAPGLGREAMGTLKACEEVIFITTPFVPSVMDVIRCQEVVNEIGIKPIGIVLNQVSKEKYEMTAKEIEQLTRLPVIASIPYDKNVKKSLAAKLPVVIYRPNSKASKEFIKLAAFLVGEKYERKSIFSRILRIIKIGKKEEILFPQPL